MWRAGGPGLAGPAGAASTPSFTITSPTNGATVSTPVAVVVTVRNATIGTPLMGMDHLHVSIDGGPQMAIYKPGPIDLPLPAGKHTISVELAGPTHEPLLPPKVIAITVR